MAAPIITVQHLSKKYIIGENLNGRGARTFRDLFDHRLKSLFGRNGREQKYDSTFWALKDVSFEVHQSEVVGIIGRNGAGKSTLLKILSRITEPTEGKVTLRGRVASLLEVGTGFNMELTGRENIYLNGAILGMRKSEIARKFDEIVDFAEIEKFLDTPVKRYSSGMYVRLAFSIAAHLEPDILIVDEVLAVGDAEFQSKCLGKMKDVSSAQGRTVLFVTHNMASLESLCQRSILLQKGVVKAHGETKDMIKLYLQKQNNEKKEELVDRSDRSGKGGIRFTRLEFLSTKDEKLSALISGRTIKVRAHFQIYDNSDHNNCRIGVTFNRQAVPLFLLASELVSKQSVNIRKDGFFDFKIEQFPLSKGVYEIDLFLESNKEIQDWVISAGNIDVEDGDFYKGGRNYPIGWEGKTVLVNHEFFLYEN